MTVLGDLNIDIYRGSYVSFDYIMHSRVTFPMFKPTVTANMPMVPLEDLENRRCH